MGADGHSTGNAYARVSSSAYCRAEGDEALNVTDCFAR